MIMEQVSGVRVYPKRACLMDIPTAEDVGTYIIVDYIAKGTPNASRGRSVPQQAGHHEAGESEEAIQAKAGTRSGYQPVCRGEG